MWSELDGRVVVVGAGFLGRALVDDCARAGAPVTLVHRAPIVPAPEWADADVRLVAGDACEPSVAREAVVDATRVVWCAGGPMPAESERRLRAALDATLAPLLCFFAELGHGDVERFTYVSSGGTVYGGHRDDPIPEDTVPEPTTAYGITRLAAEHCVRRACGQHGVEPLLLRCGNVYGPGQPGDRSQGLVAAALAAARSGRRLPVYGDGGAVRDYLYVDDFVRVVAAFVARDLPYDVFNVGSGHGTSVHEVIATVEAVTGAAVAVEHEPARSCDGSRVVLDTSRLRSVHDFEAVPVEVGIAATWSADGGGCPAVNS